MSKPRKAEFKFDERSLVQIAWLIEKPGPCWLYVADWAGFDWTMDSLKAIRFARREDAEQVLLMLETEDCKATEHQWGIG